MRHAKGLPICFKANQGGPERRRYGHVPQALAKTNDRENTRAVKGLPLSLAPEKSFPHAADLRKSSKPLPRLGLRCVMIATAEWGGGPAITS